MAKAAMVFCVIGLMLTDIDQVMGGWGRQYKVTSLSSEADHHSSPCYFKVSVIGYGVDEEFELSCTDKQEYIYGSTQYALYVSDKGNPFRFAFFTDKTNYLAVVRNNVCEEINYTKNLIGKPLKMNPGTTSDRCEAIMDDIVNKLK